MNLREMTQRVQDKTRHSSKVAASREIIARDLSEAHRRLMTEFEWPWLRRTTPWWQLPEYVGNAVLATNPSTQMTLVGTLDPGLLTDEWANYNSDALIRDLENLTGEMVDGEVELYDRVNATYTGFQNWDDAPFRIERISSTVSDPASISWSIFLDPRFVPDATAALTTTVIRMVWRRKQLPTDCLMPLWVNDENGREIKVVSAAEAADYQTTGTPVAGLDIREQTGTQVQCYILDDGPDRRMPYPGRMINDSVASGDEDQWATFHRRDYGQDSPPPVHQSISIASNNSGSGTLDVGTTYRVFVSWFVSGRFGPRSEIETTTLTSGNDSLALTNLPAYPSGHHANGRRLSIWLSDASSERAFVLAGFVSDEQDPDVILNHNPRAQSAIQADSAGVNYPDFLLRWDDEYRSRYQFLRPWPRMDTFQRHTLTYLAHPRQLIEPMDEPDPVWEPFHDVLVYKVLIDLCNSFGARTQMRGYEREHARIMRRLRARFKPREISRARGLEDMGRAWLPWPESGVDYQG